MRDCATLFSNLMDVLWDNEQLEPGDFIIKALADKLRGTVRLNPENALDVLDYFALYVRDVDVRQSIVPDEADVAIFTVKFDDDSSLLIVAKRGIGSQIELL